MMILRQRYAVEFVPTGEMIPSPQYTGGGTASDTFLGASVEVVSGATVHYEYVYSGNQTWDNLTVAVDSPSDVDIAEFPLIKRDGGFTGEKLITLDNGRGKCSVLLDFSDDPGSTTPTLVVRM
jgi:hypothetical protein